MGVKASTSKGWLRGASLSVGIVLVFLLVVGVNYFSAKYYKRFDWTSTQIYTLSEKSVNVIRELDRDVDVIITLAPMSETYAAAKELLNRYAAESSRITFQEIDPERNLAEAQRLVDEYNVSQPDVVVFEAGDERRVIESGELADYDYSAMQYGGAPRMTAFKGEQLFTGAIMELMESRKPRILFTTGHGERGISDFSALGMSQLSEMLGRDNFEIEEWPSLGESSVPEGTDLLVIAGPTTGLLEPEIEVIGEYLRQGGRLLAMLDPVLSQLGGLESTGLAELLAQFGVVLGEDVIVDPEGAVPLYGADTFFVSSYGDHELTRSLRQADVSVIVPAARSVRRSESVEGLDVAELFTTTPDGWGETDLADLGAVEREDSDVQGPVSLAVAVRRAGIETIAAGQESEAEGEDEEGARESDDPSDRTRLVVIGDSDFASNGQLFNAANGPLTNNIFNWLVERESHVGIPPKTPEQTTLVLDQSQLSTISWLVLVIMPGLAVAAGIAVHLRRRR